MIKTRIYLTSGSYVDVQEPFNEVNYVMMHSAPTWTFTLKTESGDPVCVARDHVAYFTTREQDKQQKQKAEQTLTYLEFCIAFDKHSPYHGPYACESHHGGVVIFTSASVPRQRMASLDSESRNWVFNAEAKILVFDDEELTLMAKLATTPPELRGEFDDERGGKRNDQ